MTKQLYSRRSGIAKRMGPIGLAIVLALCASATTHAQAAAKPAPPAMAKDADPDWDVASVKATDPATPRGQHITMDGRRVSMTGTTVEQFLMIGYGLQRSQFVNMPPWADTERWDVTGVLDTAGTPGLKQVQSLMRKILVERFGLQLHHEQREMPVFSLTVAKGGPKLVENTSNPDGSMDQYNSQSNGRRSERLTNTAISELVLILQFYLDRPIVDRTNLKGRYDLKLQWTLDNASPSDAPDAPPPLFTALQEQAGLKLDRVKAPADVIVLDDLQKPRPD